MYIKGKKKTFFLLSGNIILPLANSILPPIKEVLSLNDTKKSNLISYVLFPATIKPRMTKLWLSVTEYDLKTRIKVPHHSFYFNEGPLHRKEVQIECNYTELLWLPEETGTWRDLGTWGHKWDGGIVSELQIWNNSHEPAPWKCIH